MIKYLSVIMKISIFKNNGDKIEQIEEQILFLINKYHLSYDENEPDVVFFIGGDGTFLRAVQHYLSKIEKISFVGINTGTLGFFYDYQSDEIEEVISKISEGKYSLKTYPLLNASIKTINKEESLFAINEIRIENPFHTLTSDVYINDEYLETFRGNGLNICTSFGSSGYNRSLGGAVIDNSLNLIELTEIAPIVNNAYRSLGSSLILDGKNTIKLVGNFTNVVIGYDHLTLSTHGVIEEILLTLSKDKIKLIYTKDRSYINRLNRSFIKR